MNLYEFYTSPVYAVTPEVTAIQEHVKGSVLFVGNYASASLAPHFPESFAAVPDQNVLFSCQTNNEADIKYAGADLKHLPYPDDSFDTVVSAYIGTHTDDIILSELKRVAKKRLLIMEPDPNSQYVEILNAIDPKPIPDPASILADLGEYSVMEEIIESTYSFDEESFVEYLTAEFHHHEGTTVDDSQIASEYVKTVSERCILFVCQ